MQANREGREEQQTDGDARLLAGRDQILATVQRLERNQEQMKQQVLVTVALTPGAVDGLRKLIADAVLGQLACGPGVKVIVAINEPIEGEMDPAEQRRA